ncbi:hypothetical protein PMAG_b0576 [Pseudoalteromonas mariniglutinosa NCIMB 1770]|nr:hypothetical protein [Pseudoalteromonas mariniglutinosa NCIMB 1770]
MMKSAVFLVFLSCLCGSERDIDFIEVGKRFLSCLCGSERPCL